MMQLDLPTPLSALYSNKHRLEMDFPLLLDESAKVFDDLLVMKQQVNSENTLLSVCIGLLQFSSGEINDSLCILKEVIWMTREQNASKIH